VKIRENKNTRIGTDKFLLSVPFFAPRIEMVSRKELLKMTLQRRIA